MLIVAQSIKWRKPEADRRRKEQGTAKLANPGLNFIEWMARLACAGRLAPKGLSGRYRTEACLSTWLIV
jgi:hypothetical protein